MKQIIASLALLFGVGFAAAGSDLQEAVDLWLSGNDAESLPILSKLAKSGDTDARLLLAQIEVTDKGPSPYRLSLSKQQARDLFRQVDETSPFATSWLTVEAQSGDPLAAALLRARSADPDPEVILQLAALGEHQATDHPSRIVSLYGTPEDRQTLANSPHLLSELAPYVAYLSDTPEPRGDGLAALRHIIGRTEGIDANDAETLGIAGLLALGFGFGDASPANRWYKPVQEWVMTAPETRPIANLCNAQCGSQAPACGMAMMALAGGYFEVIRIDSPLEKLIPQKVFLDSKRAQLMTLRRAALARSETNNPPGLNEIAAFSQCAADLVQQERQAYRKLK
ncbi:hypothetical protein J7426_23825 [Tropicibacter sp. R16_0]|uniref:hypothetical protein n=1 Tax=Tropicibacter sp. R16_0 TaxID=2821102 RepID=UPI001ADAD893|nr:hypothetical protein [Tropicibacter sp. R16_0]MBO9453309.1 hypothetical protein [Tropicibacter sp. R16_0]